MPTTLFSDDSLSFLPQQWVPLRQINTFPTGTVSSSGSSSGSESSSYNEGSNSPIRSPDTTTEDTNGGPYLQMVTQPYDKFRFRYKTEMQGTHGAILSHNIGQRSKKEYPKVKLCNYTPGKEGYDPIIRCTLYTADDYEDRRVPHVHRLIGKWNGVEQDDPHDFIVHGPSYTAELKQLTILFTKKEDQEKVLIQKKLVHAWRKFTKNEKSTQPPYRPTEQLRLKVQEELMNINLNVACLRFDALIDRGLGVYDPICKPIYSSPINNMKNPQTNELRICRVDKWSGTCLGGDEVFMFVEKVVKKNIKVKFYEEGPDREVIWEDYGVFTTDDVHHQYGIAFRTPCYRDPNITTSVDVFFQLERPSDKAVSEHMIFQYQPNPNRLRDLNRKRPRQESTSALPVVLHDYPKFSQTLSHEVPNYNVDDLVEPLLTDDQLLFGDGDDITKLFDNIGVLMDTEEPVTSLGSSSDFSFSKLLEKLPSPDSEAICQFLTSDRIEEYARINKEEEALKMLRFNQGQVAGGFTSDLEFDGLCNLQRHSKPSSGLPFKTADQAPFIENSAYTIVYPEIGPTIVQHQMDCPTNRTSLCPDFEVNKDEFIERQNLFLDETILRNLKLGNINQRLDNTLNEVATGYRKNTKNDSIHTLCEKLRSSKLNDNHRMMRDKNLPQFQMDTEISPVPTTVRNRTSAKLMLNESNVVQKTQNALNNLMKIKKIKKLKEKFFQNCLIRLFSYTVEEFDDSVLHIVATSNETPVPVQATKFIDLLKAFNVIDSLINIQNNKNETPLLVAAARGTPYMVTQFLDAGADLDASDIKGNTALHLAVLRDTGSMDVVDVLLPRLPNLIKYNEDGYTALHLAVYRRKSDVISALLIKSEDDVYKEDLINKQDRKRGNTALHIAVENRFKEVVKLLVNFDEQIEIDAKNFDGKTALAFVLRESDPLSKEIADLLLATKADPNLAVTEKGKKEEYKNEFEPELEIIDVDENCESLDEVSAYAREWGENNELFDKATISKLCPLLDKNEDWIKLFKRLKYSNSEIDYCKIHWSPSLSAFRIAGLSKSKITAEVVRDELFTMAPHLRCGAQYIDDMLLKRLGVD